MSSRTIATHAPKGSDLPERVEEYREKNDMQSSAEAVRALLNAGLEAEREEEEPDTSLTRREEWVDRHRTNAFGLAVFAALTLSAAFVSMLFFQAFLGWSMDAIPMQVIWGVLVVALIAFTVGSVGGGLAHLYLAVKMRTAGSSPSEVEA